MDARGTPLDVDTRGDVAAFLDVGEAFPGDDDDGEEGRTLFEVRPECASWCSRGGPGLATSDDLFRPSDALGEDVPADRATEEPEGASAVAAADVEPVISVDVWTTMIRRLSSSSLPRSCARLCVCRTEVRTSRRDVHWLAAHGGIALSLQVRLYEQRADQCSEYALGGRASARCGAPALVCFDRPASRAARGCDVRSGVVLLRPLTHTLSVHRPFSTRRDGDGAGKMAVLIQGGRSSLCSCAEERARANRRVHDKGDLQWRSPVTAHTRRGEWHRTTSDAREG